MLVTPIKTEKIFAKTQTLEQVLTNALPKKLPEKCILAISSKIISLCEGRVMPIKSTNKEVLIKREAEHYLPASFTQYGYHFTIIHNTLLGAAGIDQSNGNNHYVLLPKNPQKTANKVRAFIKSTYQLKNVGVIITDSVSMPPLRRGTMGIALAYSGFMALNNYIGKLDLFQHPLIVSQANIAGGLAATAVLAMGEGAEQTPICLIENAQFVTFLDRNPTVKELQEVYVSLDSDLFAPFLKSAPWK